MSSYRERISLARFRRDLVGQNAGVGGNYGNDGNPSPPPVADPVFIQALSNQQSSGAPMAFALTAPSTAGTMLGLLVNIWTTGAAPTFPTPAGWTLRWSANIAPGGGAYPGTLSVFAYFFDWLNNPGASDGGTLEVEGASDIAWVEYEFSGVTVFDHAGAGASGGAVESNAFSTSAITTAASVELLIGIVADGAPFSPGLVGMASSREESSPSLAMGYKITSSTGTFGPYVGTLIGSNLFNFVGQILAYV
jgi:hypothetical protein